MKLKRKGVKDMNNIENEKILDKGYLMSPRDNCALEFLPELIKLGIDSFKIEGRMKSKEYVGFITKLYRRLIDSLEEETDEEEKQLKSLFHREFTNGYLKEEKNIMNFKTANHIGIPIGEVIKVTPKKIKIKLTEEQVKMIANNYLEKSVGTEMKIYLNIVMPNVGLKPILPDTRVYKEAKETRLAYVCEFNNEARKKIYIDCTTGEAIGMSRVLGGEF